jgi:hypothetical protein
VRVRLRVRQNRGDAEANENIDAMAPLMVHSRQQLEPTVPYPISTCHFAVLGRVHESTVLQYCTTQAGRSQNGTGVIRSATR